MLDLYELLYRDLRELRNLRNEKPGIHVKPSEDAIAYVKKAILELGSIEPKASEVLKFSDVIYSMMPVVNKDNSIRYEYAPMLANKNEKADVREHIRRFENFSLDNLPLIEVAKYLGIEVEKTNILEVWGRYRHRERKITLGTDYEPVFIHELAHAIDHYSDNLVTESAFMELVAESSVVVLCKYYNIQNDPSASKDYLLYYAKYCFADPSDIFRHVAKIFETVKFIKRDITNGR